MTDGRSYGGESLEDRVARRRRQLLDAGLHMFGTTGFRKSTVRQLCRLARVADRYFYDEFANTEDLLLAVYDECHAALRDAVLTRIAELDADTPLDDVIAQGIDAFLARAEADPPLARLVWFEILGVNRTVERHHVRRLVEFGELIGQLIESRGATVSATGAARSVHLTAVAGGVSQTTMNWIDEEFRTPRADLVSSLVPFVLSASTSPPSPTRRRPAGAAPRRPSP